MAAKPDDDANTDPPAETERHDHAAPLKRAGETIPPTPLKELLSAGGANVFLLSADTELVATVQRAAGEQYPVFVVPDWAGLETGIESGRCGIALLDAELLGTHLVPRILKLAAYSNRVVVLVAAPRSEAEGLMSLLSQRRIHRLLIKPTAPGITRLLIESAVKRCLQLREHGDAGAAIALPAPRRASKRPPPWLFAAGGAALIAAGAALVVGASSWWGAPAGEDGGPTEPAPAATASQPVLPAPPPTQEPRFADLLMRAEQAFREGRLTAPAGDNALDYYLTVLAADPTQPFAREQLATVVGALFGQAESALLAGSVDAAAEALASIRRAEPASGRLQFLEAQLERLRGDAAPQPAVADESGAPAADAAAAADDAAAAVRAELAGNLATAARTAIAAGDLEAAEPLIAEARKLQADRAALSRLDADLAAARAERAALRHAEWLATAQQRLRDNALVVPETDSARHFLMQLQGEAPDFPGLDVAWRDWGAAVARAVQADVAGRRWESAAALVAAVRESPDGESLAEPLRAELAFGRRQEQHLATAAPASEFTLLERVAPIYPDVAERRGVEGWVDLEFTIDTTGSVRDVLVTASQPPQRFDESAITAVSQYRYAPFEEDGRRYARRARLRVRFTLQ